MAERSLTVTWNDPAELAARAQSSSGLEFLQAIVAGELPPAPIQALLGFHLVEVEEGRVVFAGEPAEQHSGGQSPPTAYPPLTGRCIPRCLRGRPR